MVGYSLEESFTIQGSRKDWIFIKIYGNRQPHTIGLMELFDNIGGGERSTKVDGNSEKTKGDWCLACGLLFLNLVLFHDYDTNASYFCYRRKRSSGSQQNQKSFIYHRCQTLKYYCTTNGLLWLLYNVLESNISPVDERIKSTCRWVRSNTRSVL